MTDPDPTMALHKPEPDCPTAIAGEKTWRAEVLIAETRVYGLLHMPKTIEDVVQMIGYLQASALNFEGAGHWPWIWRGQSDYRWRLEPGAVRRLRSTLRPAYWGNVEQRVREYESELLSEARLAGHGSSRGRELADLELLALLQHHGAATRLLDFTTNLFVALWFASIEAADTMGLVVGIAPTTWLPARSVLSRETPGAIVEVDPHGLFAFEPTPVHARVQAQSSVFALGCTVDEVWGSLPLPVFSHRLIAFGVTPELKRHALSWCTRLLGFSEKSLFPDLSGFGRHHASRRPVPFRFLEGIDRDRRTKEGPRFETFRTPIDVADEARIPEAPAPVSADEKDGGEPAYPPDLDPPPKGTLRVLDGETACHYWYLLNRAAGHPRLGVNSAGETPNLAHQPPSGALRQRQTFEAQDGSFRSLVSVEDGDVELARNDRITDEDRHFMERARSLAIPVERNLLRSFTEPEEQVFEESARARVYWIGEEYRALHPQEDDG